MSHSKEEEEIEDVKCIESHLSILEANIKTMRKLLDTSSTKKEYLQALVNTHKEAKGIIKRLKYMIDDATGKLSL